MPDAPTFPFVAVTGQPMLKLALTLLAVNPRIGGVLISGPRGSAKTTLARGLADLLPASEGQFVTLPLGASEDMLIGSLDLQQALSEQQISFNPGLLAKAHQGVLYVDEVNLLPDALVDQLLDVAASRINIIERDGISHQHPADFLLIGTMNPDEGELRPQLQDRFGLSVALGNQYRIEERIEIVERREAFDHSAGAFVAQYATEQAGYIQRINKAQGLLPTVQCATALRRDIAQRCHAANVDGMRADIVWYRAARSHAAWQGRDHVAAEDITAVEALVLEHRKNETAAVPPAPPPFSRPPAAQHKNDDERSKVNKPSKPPPQNTHQPTQAPADAGAQPEPDTNDAQTGDSDWGKMPPQQQRMQRIDRLSFDAKPSFLKPKQTRQRSKLLAGRQRGQEAGGSRRGERFASSIDWFSTLACNTRRDQANWRWHHQKARTGKTVLHLILLDTSASTLAAQAFAKSKGLVLQIAEQAYLLREQLAVMSFGQEQVKWLLPQVRAPKQLTQRLNQTPAGGGTPIREVLQQAQRYVLGVKRQHPQLHIQTYLLTDGRTTQSIAGLQLAGHCVLIDTEQATVKRGRARELAQQLGADYHPL